MTQPGIGKMSCHFMPQPHQTAFPPASDIGRYVDFDVCASTAAAYFTGTVSLDMAFAHTPTLLQSRLAAQHQ